jgi:hypothetical protein
MILAAKRRKQADIFERNTASGVRISCIPIVQSHKRRMSPYPITLTIPINIEFERTKTSPRSTNTKNDKTSKGIKNDGPTIQNANNPKKNEDTQRVAIAIMERIHEKNAHIAPANIITINIGRRTNESENRDMRTTIYIQANTVVIFL